MSMSSKLEPIRFLSAVMMSRPSKPVERMASLAWVSPRRTWYRLGMSGSLETPRPLVALPWGSESTTSTRISVAASDAARLMAVVVFPTPPFWLAIAKTLLKRSDYHAVSRETKSVFHVKQKPVVSRVFHVKQPSGGTGPEACPTFGSDSNNSPKPRPPPASPPECGLPDPAWRASPAPICPAPRAKAQEYPETQSPPE